MCEILVALGDLDRIYLLLLILKIVGKTREFVKKHDGKKGLEGCMSSDNEELKKSAKEAFDKVVELTPLDELEAEKNPEEQLKIIEKQVKELEFSKAKPFYEKLSQIMKDNDKLEVSEPTIECIIKEIKKPPESRPTLVPIFYTLSNQAKYLVPIIKSDGIIILVTQFNTDDKDEHLYKDIQINSNNISKESGDVLCNTVSVKDEGKEELSKGENINVIVKEYKNNNKDTVDNAIKIIGNIQSKSIYYYFYIIYLLFFFNRRYI